MDTTTVSINISLPRDGIAELALELAQLLTNVERPSRDFPIPAQVEVLSRFIREAYVAFEQASSDSQVSIPPAAEWILDNYYVIEQATQQIIKGMPADYYRRLPKSSFKGGRVMARVYILTTALVQSTQGRFDADAIQTFIRSYQSIFPLKIGEIWALAIMFRLCVLETLGAALANIRETPFASSYPQFNFQFVGESETAEGSPVPLTDDNIVANCIISLRMLSTQDWKAFFEGISLVEGSLREDPAGIYESMDFETRNHYRDIVEEMAQNAAWDELKIAQTAISLAEQNGSEQERHIGYYLIGPGRRQLEVACKYRAPLDRRFLRWLDTHAMPVYLGSILALIAFFDLIIAGYVMYANGSIGQIIVAMALGLLPASAGAVHIIHRLVALLMPPQTLPKLEFRYGIPAEFSSVVVIPAM
jgi:cyclic beta-1,2-glucan synthetase